MFDNKNVFSNTGEKKYSARNHKINNTRNMKQFVIVALVFCCSLLKAQSVELAVKNPYIYKYDNYVYVVGTSVVKDRKLIVYKLNSNLDIFLG